MLILAGDVGGTKTALGIFETSQSGSRLLHSEVYASAEHDSLTNVAAIFLRTHPDQKPTQACFAVAGPLTRNTDKQTASLTNLAWKIDSAALATTLQLESVQLLNDFEAIGYGIDLLDDQDIVTLQAGSPDPHKPRAILGAGTGLGQAVQLMCGNKYETIATEGGHVDFAPQDQAQIELLMELQKEFGHVSYERLLSGAGFVRIWQYVRENAAQTGAENTDHCTVDSATTVSRLALQDRDPIAQQALDLFARIYGAQAGNLALTTMALGGIYLCGGIAPGILEKLKDGSFIDAFNDKGRMSPITRSIPVHVIVNPKVGLLGAATYSARNAASLIS